MTPKHCNGDCQEHWGCTCCIAGHCSTPQACQRPLPVDDEPWIGVTLFEFAAEFRYSIAALLGIAFGIAYAVLR